MSKKENLGELITDNKKNAEKLSSADIKAASNKANCYFFSFIQHYITAIIRIEILDI
jgi:hypothetical protein